MASKSLKIESNIADERWAVKTLVSLLQLLRTASFQSFTLFTKYFKTRRSNFLFGTNVTKDKRKIWSCFLDDQTKFRFKGWRHYERSSNVSTLTFCGKSISRKKLQNLTTQIPKSEKILHQGKYCNIYSKYTKFDQRLLFVP